LIVKGSLAALNRWLGAGVAQRNNLLGIHHLVASGATTWHGFATAIFAEASTRGLLERQPQVIPISSSEFPTPAERPTWSLLDNSGFQRHFGILLPDWQHGLHEVMQKIHDTQLQA
jgi:dTDP-4-dehydrorhamnose reductase